MWEGACGKLERAIYMWEGGEVGRLRVWIIGNVNSLDGIK